jgi:hypothetical protein
VAVAETEIELEIGAGGAAGEYAVRVIHAAGGGEPRGNLCLDVDDLAGRRSGLEDSVLASGARARRRVAVAEQPLRQVGQELFAALFGGQVGSVYRASLAVARERDSRLRVVLRLMAPELSVLPWEALYDPESEIYLCRKEPLVRHIPALYTPDPIPVELPLRILGLIASPRGLPTLDVEAEQEQLQRALAVPIASGKLQLEWLAQASWDGVHERLLTERWHVLHFIGHGDYDPDIDEGRLALLGENGRAEWVGASALADLLGEAEPTPRLVLLNSCTSGQGGKNDLFSGTAATLVRSGIAAVAAMQFSVTDRAAIAFSKGFYTALAAGRAVDDAVRSGRIAILGACDGTLEWVTPVLYLRGNANQLFTLSPPPPHRGERDGDNGNGHRPKFALVGLGLLMALVALALALIVLPDPPNGPDFSLLLQASEAASDGSLKGRSGASDETTLLLEDGGTATWAVDVPESGEYEFVVRYSNDNHGELETVAVSVDGDIVGEFEALDTGDDGEGWNVFYESPSLGPYRIEAGEREFSLSVAGGDGYGVEIDNILLD